MNSANQVIFVNQFVKEGPRVAQPPFQVGGDVKPEITREVFITNCPKNLRGWYVE